MNLLMGLSGGEAGGNQDKVAGRLQRPLSLPQMDADFASASIIDDIQSHVRAVASTWSVRANGVTSISALASNSRSRSRPPGEELAGPLDNAPLCLERRLRFGQQLQAQQNVAQAQRPRASSSASTGGEGGGGGGGWTMGDQNLDGGDEDDEDDDDADLIMGDGMSNEQGPQRDGASQSTADNSFLRRERNRMHAKLTRDRKKLFTSRVNEMISLLETQNSSIRERLKEIEGGPQVGSQRMDGTSGTQPNAASHGNSSSSGNGNSSSSSSSSRSVPAAVSAGRPRPSAKHREATAPSNIPLTVGDSGTASSGDGEIRSAKATHASAAGQEWWRVPPGGARSSTASGLVMGPGLSDLSGGLVGSTRKSKRHDIGQGRRGGSSSPEGSSQGSSDAGHPSGSDEGLTDGSVVSKNSAGNSSEQSGAPSASTEDQASSTNGSSGGGSSSSCGGSSSSSSSAKTDGPDQSSVHHVGNHAQPSKVRGKASGGNGNRSSKQPRGASSSSSPRSMSGSGLTERESASGSARSSAGSSSNGSAAGSADGRDTPPDTESDAMGCALMALNEVKALAEASQCHY